MTEQEFQRHWGETLELMKQLYKIQGASGKQAMLDELRRQGARDGDLVALKSALASCVQKATN